MGSSIKLRTWTEEYLKFQVPSFKFQETEELIPDHFSMLLALCSLHHPFSGPAQQFRLIVDQVRKTMDKYEIHYSELLLNRNFYIKMGQRAFSCKLPR